MRNARKSRKIYGILRFRHYFASSDGCALACILGGCFSWVEGKLWAAMRIHGRAKRQVEEMFQGIATDG
jgi:hypothetical protein